MTSVWMLSKESMKGLDVVSTTTDLLYTLEQLEAGRAKPQDETSKKVLDRGQRLLARFEAATRTQITNARTPDLFLSRILVQLEKELNATPSELIKTLERAEAQLRSGSPTNETKRIVERISELTMKSTNQSVAAISNPLQ